MLEQEPEPSAGTKRPKPRLVALFKREIYHAPVGWYFSGYWLKEQNVLPQHCGLVLQQLLAEGVQGTPAAAPLVKYAFFFPFDIFSLFLKNQVFEDV